MFLPLELTLRPSRIYAIVLTIVHGFAILAVWLPSLSVWTKALLTAAISVSMIWAWRENSSNPGGLRVTQSGQIEMLDGEWQPAEIKGQAVVLPWFASMTITPKEGKPRRIMFWPDSVNADDFRKFRVWLKWGRLPKA